MLLKNFPDRADFLKLAEEFNVIPLCAEILADVETPVSVLRKFVSRMPADAPIFLFESAEGGDRWGRYSFLGVQALETVEVFRDHVQILREPAIMSPSAGESIPHHGNPLGVLREIMKRFRAAELPQLPGFFGGLVGYFTYEMVSFQENRVPNDLSADVPLAHLMIPRRMIIFDNARQAMTCVETVFLEDVDSEKILEAYKDGEKRLREFVAEVEFPSSGGVPEGRGGQRYHVRRIRPPRRLRRHPSGGGEL